MSVREGYTTLSTNNKVTRSSVYKFWHFWISHWHWMHLGRWYHTYGWILVQQRNCLNKSNSYFFFIGTAHSRQECLFEASQFLPSLLGGGWCGVGGGGGGHVGHRLDDLGHEVGMASQLDLPIRVERRFLKSSVIVKPAIPHRRQ